MFFIKHTATSVSRPGIWLSLLLALAVALLSWFSRQPLPPSTTHITLPDIAVTTAIARDRTRLDTATLAALVQPMEAAWEASFPEDCVTHLPQATRLANEFPSLLSAWRVLWHCATLDEYRHEQMRLWIVQLLNQVEAHDLEASRYRERGLPVHNLTDALAYASFNDWIVFDAWYETYANNQQLRIGLSLWDTDKRVETRVYFTPRTTISAYARLLNTDESCRIALADCILKANKLTGYSGPPEVAKALASYADGEYLQAMQTLYDQSGVSLQAAVQLSHWLLEHPHIASNRAEILPEVINDAIKHNSAQAKLLKALMVQQQKMEAGEDDTAELLRQAQDELAADEFAYWQAYYLNLVDPDPAQYRPRYLAAASAGSSQAMYMLAEHLAENDGRPNDILMWLLRAANQNHRDAMFEMGLLFLSGEGVEEDIRKSIYWWRQAGQLGHMSALEKLHYELILDKTGIENAAQIEYWAGKLGAELGAGYILQNLSFLAKRGQFGATHSEATYWLQLASAQDVIEAQLSLSSYYQLGFGTEVDEGKAIYWLFKAADNGSLAARHRIGQQYYHGTLLPQNYAQAFIHFHKAATQGHTPSQLALGQMFTLGKGVEENFELALMWYQKAADNGDKMGYNNLATILKSNLLGSPDLALAHQLYQKASDAGAAISRTRLAELYDSGLGVEPDAKTALMYFYQGDLDLKSAHSAIKRLEITGKDAVTYILGRVTLLEQAYLTEDNSLRAGDIAAQAYELLDDILHRPNVAELKQLWLDRGAESGHPKLAHIRASLLSDGGEKMSPQACADYKRSYEAGRPYAFYFHAICELDEYGNINLQQRVDTRRKALEKQLPGSREMLADLLYDNYTVNSAEYKEAMTLYRELADEGNTVAAFRLAYYYETQYPDRLAPRVRYYKIAAAGGNAAAQNNLGRFLLSTDSGFADKQQGWDWVYLSHLQGNQGATDTLGEVYEYGWNGEMDWDKAVDYYLQAGKAGSALSYHNAARLLNQGGHGLQVDPARSRQYASRAHDMGYQGGNMIPQNARIEPITQ